MPLSTISAAEAISGLRNFSSIIDARSPSEFALDHLPGAVNWPSLDDAERALVGTEYKQVAPFAARKHGAALVARNIAMHIERHVLELPRDWSPLVYCWRGGQRSSSLAAVLGQIGFRVHLLEGGYRQYRRAIVADLERLPALLQWRVVCGPTGSGKSRLLQALRDQGAQVLDLEGLANHRGSVLGLVPGTAQPTQKAFDSALWNALRQFDPARPVFVESESRKVGDLRVAEPLVAQMRSAPCVWLELALDARVALLLADYAFFVSDTPAFTARLDALRVLLGNELVDAWQGQAQAGNSAQVVRDLLLRHYDPVYQRSLLRNYADIASSALRIAWDGSDRSLDAAAHQAIERCP
ncbi:MAG: tRNA 2-selenouridine(34) synthase MnmH [Pseudomonadota bacterium]|nr:tRNA 2-selenouridine(34) synthase MnmH [Pseudomonadota bacterium]